MNSLLKGQLGAFALLLLIVFLDSTSSQDCLAKFKSGREDFILDVDDSVKYGATFLSSPKLSRYEECVSACCKDPRCNVAFMERGTSGGSVNSCFLFDCLYKKKYVCRFVTKPNYISYLLDSVYEEYLAVESGPPDASDRAPLANGGPDRVVQPHDTVTLNGLESKDDNGIVSYHWQMLSGNPYAVIEKANFEDQIIVSNLSSGVYKFQLTVTDTVGQSDSTKITILVLTPEQSEHHCMAPKKVGPCRGSFPRWHYNAASEQCEKFTFGGCKENLNNYLTKDECNNACYGSEKKSGTGRGLPISNPQVRCTQTPDTGTCRDSFTKWYYSPRKQDCFRFNYGGCQGNENRFDSKESCMIFCRGVTEKDVYIIQGQIERSVSADKTGVIVIAALLGVAIAVLLGILMYCLMKGKKKSSQHRSVPANTAQFTSLEDKERLVYNRTTKPI
ncbi:kunitz-type protease inhibitor 1a isoform X2 [Channa argus]|uniref:kunitz-type protease inhibitor 1a isoform X2 n=1 Tax=Channa argus TaxID=215402 RepID=UPI003522BD29